MLCPCCQARLPIDVFGRVDRQAMKDMDLAVKERKQELEIKCGWYWEAAQEQAIREIYFGAVPVK